MTLALQTKKEILASQIAYKRRLNNEERLYRELSSFFKKLKKEVLASLEEYWSDYQMLQGHINLICAPVHEAHREYYEIIKKYKLKEYQLGKEEATRLCNRAGVRYAFKETIQMPINGFIKKNSDTLFGTLPKAEQDLLNRTFKSSEKTLSRVDDQLNKIITDGYRGGKGINDIANQVTKRFDQLSSWEAKRIARTEVNTSHNKATIDTYQDFGVEYTQWIAAADDRTRDSHVEVDGEIIPMGGKYSNGLGYPGDMSGPIEEWINCRCSNAPFVIPFGYMAPSFSPFRESDLIPIIENPVEPTQEQIDTNLTTEQKALYNKYQQNISDAQKVIDSLFSTTNERIQAQHLIETETIKLNQLKNIATGKLAKGYAQLVKGVVDSDTTPTMKEIVKKYDKSTEEWDINRLPDAERKTYLKVKHNYTILKEAIDHKNYSKLDELRDTEIMEIHDRKTFMELTENGTDLEIAKYDLEDYKLDIDLYEKIIKDTNIVVESLSVGIKWNRPNFTSEYVNLNDKGKYEPINLHEKFKKYHFKNEKLTIYESVDIDHARVRHIHETYKQLPDHMKKAREIVLSNQVPVSAGLFSNSRLGGYVLNKKGNTRIYQFKRTVNELKGNLRHESAHLIERDLEWFISNSKEYVDAFYADMAHLKAKGYSEDDTYITPYSRSFTKNALENGDKVRAFSEDFAESVKFYLKDKEAFIKMYPNKAKVIEKAINGKLTPENTINYWKWKEESYKKYELTQEEADRYMELDFITKPWVQNPRELTKAEQEEFQYLKDKKTFDYLNKQLVKGEQLTDKEVEAFMKLQKKHKF